MKKLLLFSLVIILILTTGTFVVANDDSKQLKAGDKKALQTGEEATFIGKNVKGEEIWQVTFGEPVYIPGTEIKYDTEWKYDGNNVISGANDFQSIVDGTSVRIDYKGEYSEWNPEIRVGITKLADKNEPQVSILAVDPINENYSKNTLCWDYGNGIKRYLRAIEGMLIEYYKIEYELEDDLLITNSLNKSQGFNYHREAYAFDNESNNVEIDKLGNHDISLSKNKSIEEGYEYPIIIDPDTTFYSSSSDGSTSYTAASVYLTARNYTSGSVIGGNWATIGQAYSPYGPGYYDVGRSYFFFDTSSLDDSANITGAVFSLYGDTDYSDTDFVITVQNGQPTYPHDPIQAGDYYYTYYSGSGGTLSTATFTTSGYNNITLDSDGISWINLTGTTKYTIRSAEDINSSAPTGVEKVLVKTYEAGSGYRPKLTVTYTLTTPSITADAASNIANNSARLNSTVTDDGGESCQIRWGYGTTSQTSGNFSLYDTLTSWSDSEWDTGEHPYEDIESLTANTTYYYRVQIKNSSENATSDEESFTTTYTISPPSNLRGYPSEESISLSWTKGDGSAKTMIRFALDTYPTDNTSGTLVYFGTASVYNHEELTSGRTYYYSGFGESSGNVTTEYTTLAMTTSASSPTDDDFEDIEAIPGWMQTTDYTKLDGLEPFYTATNNFIDATGMPRAQAWISIFLTLVAIIALIIMMKFGFIAGLFSATVLMIILGGLQQIPTYMIFLIVVIGMGVWSMSHGKEGQ